MVVLQNMNTPNPLPAQALLLAAGRGERMRPLTDTTPKPLLAVQGKPLMQWHLEALARGGVRSVCINTAWLGERIPERFGTRFTPSAAAWDGVGAAPELALRYSMEGQDFGGALETAGGIVRALPQLDEVFWLLAGDVFVPEFAFSNAVRAAFARSPLLAHIWLVPNPDHHPQGDFGVAVLPGGRLLAHNGADVPKHTYSTIGLYKKAFFAQPWCSLAQGNPEGVSAPLAPMLRAAIDAGQVGASVYPDRWVDVGTPERLAALNASGPASAALH
jgi:MurNAc alpha-1-phosphate uridylyltransferase